MTHHSDERAGGRFTFASFVILALVWLVSSGMTAGEMNEVGGAGAGIILCAGAVIGMMVGFYNFGRERGK